MGSKQSVDAILYDDTIPFVPNINRGQVIKVYDGDTFTIGFYQPHSKTPYRMSVRLRSIDAPEISSRDLKKRVNARKAQMFLNSLIMGKTVLLLNTSIEKYGRLLADVHCEGVFINQVMLDNKLAVLYDGGTKSA